MTSRASSVAYDSSVGSVTCVCAAQDFVAVTFGSLLRIWKANADSAQKQPLELPFSPVTIAAFENRLFVAETQTAAFLDVVDGSIVSLSFVFSPRTTTTETLFHSITHSRFSLDGTVVAVCGQTDVLLFGTRPECDGDIQAICEMQDDEDDEENEEEGRRTTEEQGENAYPCHSLDCSNWFGSKQCAVMTCFSASQLFVVSKLNHLISFFRPDGAPFLDFRFQRDGHVLSAAATCTALCADVAQGHLLVGMSDGTIAVHDIQSLEKSVVLKVAPIVYAHPSLPVDLSNLELPIRDIGVVSKTRFAVVTPVAVISLSRAALSVDSVEDDVIPLQAVVGASDISERGNVVCWSPFASQLCWVQLRSTVEQRAATVDIIHATAKLPSAFFDKSDEIPVTGAAAEMAKAKLVTFGRPIRSSGYVAQPWSVQQALKVKASKKSKAGAKGASGAVPLRKYDLSAPPPSVEFTQATEVLSRSRLHTAVITTCSFDASATHLVTTSGDTTLHLLKISPSPFKITGEGVCGRGHTSMVTCSDVALSLQHPLIATGSFDGSVALWRPTKRDSPYALQSIGKEVKALRFLYMDKVLAYSSGSCLSFAIYCVDDGGGDLDRKRNLSKVRVVASHTTEAQQVTTMDCMNSFLSTIVVWGGSNRQMGVYDVAASREVRVIGDSHSRPVHTVCLARNGRYASVGDETLHLCASAAMDKTVRLWDLRQPTAIRQLSSHQNASIKVGLSFSPCGKYLAVGSEDRCVVVYDVSMGAVVQQLRTPEVVTAIAFHPFERSVMAIGCSNGDVRVFGAPR